MEAAAAASGMAVGAWLGSTAEAAIHRRVDPLRLAETRDLLVEVARLREELAPVGNNVNQLARSVNSGDRVLVGQLIDAAHRVGAMLDRIDAVTADGARWIRKRS